VGKYEVAPGQLDEYYSFSSGGHSGECGSTACHPAVCSKHSGFQHGLPGGLGHHQRIEENHRHQTRWQPEVPHGDTHHIHPSYKDGTYDGKYMFVNDKIHGRLARIRMDTMETDKITELPLVQGFHGTFPDKRDPVDPAINHTTRVFCGGEFSIPLDNNGKNMDATADYRSIFSCVDSETMEVRWQVLIDGNCDLVASSYDGKLACTNQYNTENGFHYEDMMSAERMRASSSTSPASRKPSRPASSRPTAAPRCRWSMAPRQATLMPRPRWSAMCPCPKTRTA
jgi:nitrous-oxide reductase